MSYKLFYFPGACSMAVHIVLNEVGQKVELVKGRDEAKSKTAELMKINPRGQVPVLVEDGKVLKEGAAQIIYLCEKYKSDLLPSSGWERAQALQWLMSANASLHPAYSRTNFLKANGGTDAQISASRAGAQKLWDEIEAELAANGPYICGKNVTAADILITVIGHWADPGVYTYGPKTKALFEKVVARPAYQQALAAEQVDYKAAA
jgi:glutathione S-transferase